MKKLMAWMFTLACVLGLIGCKPDGTTDLLETETTLTEEAYLVPISSDMLAQGVYDTLKDEWTAFDALSTKQKMLSSHIPGICQKDFDDWAECEEFIGFRISNPLESSSWLEKGTYAGMPVGFRDAPRVQASWYGTREGHVEWMSVRSGYRNGQISIVADAKLYGDSPEGKSPDSGCSAELERLHYLANTDGNSPLITTDSGEKYVANTAYIAQGYVLYSIRVIGEPNMQNEVQETLEQILLLFCEESTV